MKALKMILPLLIALNLHAGKENSAYMGYQNYTSISQTDERVNSFNIGYDARLGKKSLFSVHSSASIKRTSDQALDIPFISGSAKLGSFSTGMICRPDIVRMGLAYKLDEDSLNLDDEIRQMPKSLYAEYEYEDKAGAGLIIKQDRNQISESTKREVDALKIVQSSITNILTRDDVFFSEIKNRASISSHTNYSNSKIDEEKTVLNQSSSTESKVEIETYKKTRNTYVNAHLWNLENILLSYQTFLQQERLSSEQETTNKEKQTGHLGILGTYNLAGNRFTLFGLTDGNKIKDSYAGLAYQGQLRLADYHMIGMLCATNLNNYENKNRVEAQLIVSKDKNAFNQNFSDILVHSSEYVRLPELLNYREELKYLDNEALKKAYEQRIRRIENLDEISFLAHSSNVQQEFGLSAMVPLKMNRLTLNCLADMTYDYENSDAGLITQLRARIEYPANPFIAVQFNRNNQENGIFLKAGVEF